MVVERNVAILGTLEADQENCKTFNETRVKLDDFIAMNSPWFLIYVIATNRVQNRESHILSCHCRDQTRHYYLIELAVQEVLILWFKSLDCVANYLFSDVGQSILMAKLSEYRPFDDILAEYMNNDIVHLVVAPKICLKAP